MRPDVPIGGRPIAASASWSRCRTCARDAIQAIKFGLTMSDDVVAVHVTDDLAAGRALRAALRAQVPGVGARGPRVPVPRARPAAHPLPRDARGAGPRHVTIVLVPERIIRHWWERFLYNQNAHRIRDALTGHPGILVADIPFRRAA